jgi:spore coat polysaccharide biosynthesis predicted glycosyltransferase SpsG
MGLLAASRVALLAGGSLLVQALALDAAVVAVPLQAEQAARVRWLAAAGAVQALPALQPAQGLADRLRALADDTGAREHLRQAARGLGLENGLDVAVDALGTLAGFN